jgi:hypothetical protein
MSQRVRIFVVLAFAIPLLVPVTAAQKPRAPAPPPSVPPPAPSHPVNSSSPNLGPSQPTGDFVMFLRGRVATNDGTPVPNDVLVARVCNNKVRQQLYASSRGDFSMQLGRRTDTFLDATAEPSSESGVDGKDSDMGIPRSELKNCELRASTAGFHTGVINLFALDALGNNIDVGVIVVERSTKIKGTTLSAIPYQAPKDARRAYEKGLEAERKANLANARKYFETAVGIYPKYAIAWFQLGNVLQKENQKEAARTAYTRATTIDNRFLPPYLSLASMAFEEANWPLLLALTDHILSLDPLNHAAVTAFIVDLDPLNCADAYFYNALANYKLDKIDAAEKSAIKAEHIALPARFPQLHLLLSEIFARKNDYATAISELKTYLELAPNATNEHQVRAQLAKLEKLNNSVKTGERPDRM